MKKEDGLVIKKYSEDTLNMSFVSVQESGESATYDMGSTSGESDESRYIV